MAEVYRAKIFGDQPHQLVVKPEGRDPIAHEFSPADFKPAEGMPTFFWVRDFVRKDDKADAQDAKATYEDKGIDKRERKRKKRRPQGPRKEKWVDDRGLFACRARRERTPK